MGLVDRCNTVNDALHNQLLAASSWTPDKGNAVELLPVRGCPDVHTLRLHRGSFEVSSRFICCFVINPCPLQKRGPVRCEAILVPGVVAQAMVVRHAQHKRVAQLVTSRQVSASVFRHEVLHACFPINAKEPFEKFYVSATAVSTELDVSARRHLLQKQRIFWRQFEVPPIAEGHELTLVIAEEDEPSTQCAPATYGPECSLVTAPLRQWGTTCLTVVCLTGEDVLSCPHQ